MKLNLKINEPKFVEVEVEFPIYSKHDIPDDTYSTTYYYRRESPSHLVSIRKTTRWLSDQTEYEINESKRLAINTDDKLDYILGRGEYESSAEEFNTVLDEAVAFLTNLKPKPKQS